MLRKLIPVMFAWWVCLSFHNMQDLVTAMSATSVGMTQEQQDAAKITSVQGEDDYLIFETNLYACCGPAKQEGYIVAHLQAQTGIVAEACTEY